MSLRIQIFLVLGLLSAAAAVALTAVESRRLGQLLVEQADEAHRFAVNTLTERADEGIASYARAQQALIQVLEGEFKTLAAAAGPGAALSLRDLPQDTLALHLADYRGASEVHMALLGDPSGHSVLYSPKAHEGVPVPPTDYSDREYYRRMIANGETTVSQVELGRRFPVPAIMVASPIFGEGRRLAGYLASSLDVAGFQVMTERAAAQLPGATVVLLDSVGRVIASSGPGAFKVMQDLSAVPLFHAAAQASSTTQEGFDPAGVQARATFASTRRPGLGWTAVVYSPTSLLAGKVARARQRALEAAALVLLAALALAYIFAGWIATPITRLAGVARAVGEGNFGTGSPALSPWTPTELRGLALALGEMTRKLEGYLAERDGRVRDLSDANAMLNESVQALKETQEKLLQAGRLAAVGQLAGGIAHDFNNLLTIILSSARFLEGEMPAGTELRRDAAEIVKAAERGAKLTRQLLAFGRRQVLMPRVVDLNAVLTDMQHMLLRLIGEDVRLDVKLCATGGASALVDPMQMEQVILNLVANARDALPRLGGGNICVELERVGPSGALAFGRQSTVVSDWLVLSVTDDGCGMGEDVRARVFEPFFTTKGPDRGTGLGLAMVYGIVKQSGGEVTVTSSEGQGSCFRVLLPVAAEDADADLRREPLGRTPPPSSATVVVVDDEPAIRLLTGRILRQAGYRVVEAATSVEVLAIARRESEPVALLLTDVVMPDLSGPKIAERFVALHPETKVLYMSGYSGLAGDGAIFDDPGHFLQKPFTPEELTAKIRAVLKQPGSQRSELGAARAPPKA